MQSRTVEYVPSNANVVHFIAKKVGNPRRPVQLAVTVASTDGRLSDRPGNEDIVCLR